VFGVHEHQANCQMYVYEHQRPTIVHGGRMHQPPTNDEMLYIVELFAQLFLLLLKIM
jgi:hypothetical protein